MLVGKIAPFSTSITVDADKSITHRALIMGVMTKGVTNIYSPSPCIDCETSLRALVDCGIKIRREDKKVIIFGGIRAGNFFVNAENSGTTARLLSGVFASKRGTRVRIDGDPSLRTRPMNRIIQPLKMMGADIMRSERADEIVGFNLKEEDVIEHLPIVIDGRELRGIDFDLQIPSAQVKSAILLAGVNAKGCTVLRGEIHSRNHTELMLSAMGAGIKCLENEIYLSPSELRGIDVSVSGDFSSAMYFLVLALLNKDSSIKVENVNINSTRTSAIELLRDLGGQINILRQRQDIEPSGDIEAISSTLKPFVINKDAAKAMIDELPLLAVAACFIEGKSVIRGAEELRHKESDRIFAITEGLKRMGAQIEESEEGLTIYGQGRLAGGCSVNAFNDHRIEMCLTIAGMLSNNGVKIEGGGVAAISFPSFYGNVREIMNKHS